MIKIDPSRIKNPGRIKIKIEVGQKWIFHLDFYEEDSFTISKIDNNCCYYKCKGMDHLFDSLDKDGYFLTLHYPLWNLIIDEPISISSPSKTESVSVIDFFKAVPSGYCACNVPKSQCDYHKD